MLNSMLLFFYTLENYTRYYVAFVIRISFVKLYYYLVYCKYSVSFHWQ